MGKFSRDFRLCTCNFWGKLFVGKPIFVGTLHYEHKFNEKNNFLWGGGGVVVWTCIFFALALGATSILTHFAILIDSQTPKMRRGTNKKDT
jgi:hypothetical protein